jgi:hypothetical protein
METITFIDIMYYITMVLLGFYVSILQTRNKKLKSEYHKSLVIFKRLVSDLRSRLDFLDSLEAKNKQIEDDEGNNYYLDLVEMLGILSDQPEHVDVLMRVAFLISLEETLLSVKANNKAQQ